MPRPRSLDPLGTSDHPAVVTDPDRQQVLVEEFQRRVAYIQASLRLARMVLPSGAGFNRSLKQLRRAVRQRLHDQAKHRLHPELEAIITHKARQYAGEQKTGRASTVSDEDIWRAAQETARHVQPRRGAPNDHILRQHVWGLMALLQETTGKPVLVTRYVEHDYSPRPANGLAEQLISLVRSCDPSIPAERIIGLITEARRAYAGRAMCFRQFFPMYGASIHPENGLPINGIGGRLERIAWSLPIYCP